MSNGVKNTVSAELTQVLKFKQPSNQPPRPSILWVSTLAPIRQLAVHLAPAPALFPPVTLQSLTFPPSAVQIRWGRGRRTPPVIAPPLPPQIRWEPLLPRCLDPVVAPLLMRPASFSLASSIFLVALLSRESRGGWYQPMQESRGRAVPTRLPSLDAASPERRYFFPTCSVDRDDRWAPIVRVC